MLCPVPDNAKNRPDNAKNRPDCCFSPLHVRCCTPLVRPGLSVSRESHTSPRVRSAAFSRVPPKGTKIIPSPRAAHDNVRLAARGCTSRAQRKCAPIKGWRPAWQTFRYVKTSVTRDVRRVLPWPPPPYLMLIEVSGMVALSFR